MAAARKKKSRGGGRGGGGGGGGASVAEKKKLLAGKKAAAPPLAEDPPESEPPAEPEAKEAGARESDVDDDDDDEDEEEESSSSVSVYDSADDDEGLSGDSGAEASDDDDDEDGSDDDEEESDDDEEGFEDQGSSDEEEDALEDQADEGEDESDDEVEILDDDGDAFDSVPRTWRRESPGGGAGAGRKGKSAAAKKKRTAGGSRKDADDDDKVAGDDEKGGEEADPAAAEAAAARLHADDLSSDDEDAGGTQNRIGRVPLHWYDEHDHVGYDVHGTKVIKSDSGDRIDQVLKGEEDKERGKFTVRDELNAEDVELTPRQLELIRRVQAGAFAHPEHDAHPDYVDYYSSRKEISGLHSGAHPPKARFQPSKYDRLQVRRLLHRLKSGAITREYLEGKVRDMNDLKKPKDRKEGETDKPFLLWRGDEEDELALRKGPQHVAAPKLPPPGHAESYVPPDEYLPTPKDLREWEELDPQDRPHGHLVPKKFPNLRSVGAYEHAVRERFERCLDLYMCPRQLKRRLNIDPESLVPQLPRARDLRPFPTAKAVEYVNPCAEGDERPMARCLAVSPDGQFLGSGGSDGFVRVWEVQTGRLLRSWDVSKLASEAEGDKAAEGKAAEGEAEEGEEKVDDDADEPDKPKKSKAKPVVALEWNPNPSHRVLLAACGRCAVILAAGTGGPDDAEVTEALLHSARKGGNVRAESKAAKAVKWIPVTSAEEGMDGEKDAGKDATKPISVHGGTSGPVCLLLTSKDVTSLRWHRRGDYFVTVSPKAHAAAVLVHQLSKGNSQQPFGKAVKGGEPQTACFHPSLPFLFVATPRHVRVYHLVQQRLVKRLLTGCRWVSSVDVHPTGDHVLVGSLDRRFVWFDLDLGQTPYRTLKYHTRAVRSASYHRRYPLMASASDDGTVHVFHAMVYSDLMRNPLVVPVKILRGHQVTEGTKLGVLGCVWHPSQPWIFTGGADGRILLWQDI